MSAERLVAIQIDVLEAPQNPDGSVALVAETPSTLLFPAEARSRLYSIWYDYGVSDKTLRDDKKRRDDLVSLGESLSLEAKIYLETPVSGGNQTEVITLGQKTQGEAVVAARQKLLRQKVEAEENTRKKKNEKKPKGVRIAIRRQKSFERRGTPPHLIH